ncbi:ARHGAP20 [Acanthosepion pharaonis]|uniref:ARHGAP20 n=1 Tax=Acanthosepion pharaonis TaxID=158019 RepID=A0A812DEC6_ACAPH|nr:ARHGAP20 [Sepia pharaonis]
MSMLRNVFGGCVSDKSTENVKNQKLKFGVPLSVALKHGYLPHPFVELLVYIAKEGVATTDLFRRPGNPNDTRRIVKRLQEGKPVVFANYNFYTLASVVKKFILKLPGGIFTPEGEEYLLEVLTMTRRFEQCQRVNEFIKSLSVGHQQLVSLLFGTWFRIVNHSDVNSMSVEALARSVAGILESSSKFEEIFYSYPSVSPSLSFTSLPLLYHYPLHPSIIYVPTSPPTFISLHTSPNPSTLPHPPLFTSPLLTPPHSACVVGGKQLLKT